MAIKSQSDLVVSIEQYLQARFPMIDFTANRVLSSLLFDAVATEIAGAYTELQQVQVEQGLSDPATSSEEGADDLAFNWNITRRGAIASAGIATFQKASQPTTNIQIGAQDGSGGVVVATSRQLSGTVVLFITTETVFLTPTTTINPQTGLYEVDARIQCLQLGAIGNVDAGLINVLQSSVPGVDFVTNKISTTGGREKEDNDTMLGRRIPTRVQGLQPGISKGLVSIALSIPNVQDAVVVDPNDTEFVRGGVGGAVDLVVLGQQLATAQQLTTYTFNQPFILLQNRPVTQISQVVAVVGLTLTTLTQGIDYEFSQDQVSVSAFSAQSNDQLSWLNGQTPTVGSQVTIQTQYDKVINDIQTILDGNDKHFITANVLVKRATQVTVDISLTVSKDSGTDSTVVSNNVAAAISNLVNNLGLGEAVQQSDLVVAIKAADGVDSVVLPFTTLAVRGSSGVADVQPTKYQYCRVDSASLTITVT